MCGGIAARRLGAEQIILLGRHADRIALAREFGATDVVSERGDEAVERVRELTDGFGVHSVLECVGLEQSMLTALSIARPGGAVGRVGVPQDDTMPGSRPAFYNDVTVSGGPAPVRAYIARTMAFARTRTQSALEHDGGATEPLQRRAVASSIGSRASMRCPTATGR